MKITVLYPRTEDSWFDFDYYVNTHMPMSAARLGDSVSRIVVERDAGPREPYSDAFHAICTFKCDSREAFEAAFLPHAAELQGDTPNYTNSKQIVIATETAFCFSESKGAQNA